MRAGSPRLLLDPNSVHDGYTEPGMDQDQCNRSAIAAFHNLASMCLDRGDGAAAAIACKRAVPLGKDGLRIGPVITGGGSTPYPPEIRARRARLLMENGFINSVVISQLTEASALLGDEQFVRSLMDYQRFYRCRQSEAVGRLPLLRIAEVFLEAPTHYGESPSKAIRHASRYEAISTASEIPEIAALADTLLCLGADFIAEMTGLAGDQHPFLSSIPTNFTIESWGVISGQDGYHLPHIHPRAWASGVLYLVTPECASEPDSRIGWLRVGPPPSLVAVAGDAWDERWVKPQPGLVVIMPAYFWHETFPMGRGEERIAVAFDIVPQP